MLVLSAKQTAHAVCMLITVIRSSCCVCGSEYGLSKRTLEACACGFCLYCDAANRMNELFAGLHGTCWVQAALWSCALRLPSSDAVQLSDSTCVHVVLLCAQRIGCRTCAARM